jgi:hypothetical protein
MKFQIDSPLNRWLVGNDEGEAGTRPGKKQAQYEEKGA